MALVRRVNEERASCAIWIWASGRQDFGTIPPYEKGLLHRWHDRIGIDDLLAGEPGSSLHQLLHAKMRSRAEPMTIPLSR